MQLKIRNIVGPYIPDINSFDCYLLYMHFKQFITKSNKNFNFIYSKFNTSFTFKL